MLVECSSFLFAIQCILRAIQAGKTSDKYTIPAVSCIELNAGALFNELEIPGTCETSKAITIFAQK